MKKIISPNCDGQILRANDVNEGFEIFCQHNDNQSLNKIDIIILDYNMPNMNGPELITKVIFVFLDKREN